ncbi:MAG: hypothetical protein A2042_09510 [Candidatus Schekmanbacteria bacterium GWA2_38_11]|uniref:Uncharacterized protein n=1 Tax=Candidatus Schekmanbacteria bacterium GWA2_38_11 TaxID=1817876 RepID=A0A1F7RMA2_9BACT|nr:MAG: hypothetical protein A2042_09510 [Candidatus Schekmanbacteria bacterium GWA2_38_11]
MGWVKFLALIAVSFLSFLYLIGYMILSFIFAVSVAFVSGTLMLSWKIPGWLGINRESYFYLACFIVSSMIISCGILALALKILRVL